MEFFKYPPAKDADECRYHPVGVVSGDIRSLLCAGTPRVYVRSWDTNGTFSPLGLRRGRWEDGKREEGGRLMKKAISPVCDYAYFYY